MNDSATTSAAATPQATSLEVIRTIADVQRRIAEWRRAGESVGLVMTMGALHEGHLSVIKRSVSENDRSIVTVFANPLQLVGDDYAHYPRREREDIELVSRGTADVFWAPTPEKMFPGAKKLPDDFLTVVKVRKLTDHLCAKAHPGLYEGIATVILKTFIIMLPDVAYFGEKDYQQLQVVRRLSADMNLPLRVQGVSTLRMDDGLAFASRNLHLTPEARRIAPGLYRVISDVAAVLADPAHPTAPVIEEARRRLVELGFDSVDYLEVVDAEELQPLARVDVPARVFGAAYLGRARLLDNVPVPRPTST